MQVRTQGAFSSVRAGQVVWIGPGLERCLQWSGPAQWIVVRVRNRSFSNTNPGDRQAISILSQLGLISMQTPVLPLSTAGRQ